MTWWPFVVLHCDVPSRPDSTNRHRYLLQPPLTSLIEIGKSLCSGRHVSRGHGLLQLLLLLLHSHSHSDSSSEVF